MNKKILFLTILLVAILSAAAFSQESLVISEKQFLALEKTGGALSLVRILENGNLLCIDEPGKGKDVMVVLVDPFKKSVVKSISVPVKTISLVAADSTGERALVFSNDERSFEMVDVKNGSSKTIFKPARGEAGFALYPMRKSRIFFIDSRPYAWGYFYDDQNRFEGEWLVKINPDESGIKAFSKIIGFDDLRADVKKAVQNAKQITNIDVNDKYIVYSAINDKGEGAVAGRNLNGDKTYRIADGVNMLGGEIAAGKPLYAYVFKKSKEIKEDGELKLYNFDTNESLTVARGKLINPVFSTDASMIASGSLKPVDKNLARMEIFVSKINGKTVSTKVLPLQEKRFFADWRFIKNDTALMLFNGKDIYVYPIK